MPIVRKTVADLKSHPPQLSAAETARLDAMTDDEITRAAESDRANPPLTEADIARARAARLVKAARERAGGSQAEFADRFQINISRLRDWERGRFLPDSVALAYLRVIAEEPKTVERLLTMKKAKVFRSVPISSDQG